MKIPLVIQPNVGENSIATIATMLSYYGCYMPLEKLRPFNVTSRGGSSPEQMRKMAAKVGLETEILSVDINALREMKLPVVARWNRRYYCIIKRIQGEKIYVADPSRGEFPMTVENFAAKFTGTVLVMKPGPGFKKGGRRPSLTRLIGGRIGGSKKQLLWLGILNAIMVALNLLMIRSTRVMLDVADSKRPEGDWFTNLLTASTDSGGKLYEALVCIMAGILLVTTIANLYKSLLIYSTAYTVAAKSGAGLFHKILSQPMHFFEEFKSGELIQRMEDNSKLDLSLVRTIVPRLMDFVMTLVYFGLMLKYQWKVALICVAVEVLYLAFSMMLKGRISMIARGRAISTANMNTAMLNGIDTIETIKTSGAERMFFTGWRGTLKEFDDNRIRETGTNAITGMLDTFHNTFSTAALLFVGAYFMIQGEFTFGIMAALQAVLGNFRITVSNCVNMVNSLQETRTDIERIDDVLRREETEVYPLPEECEPDKLPGRLEVKDLAYRYEEGDPMAIEDISFSVEQGQMVAIVGSSGCGKSTLLKCLLALYEPAKGEIRYGGYTRSEIPDVVFHSTVTAVDQECVVFEDSISNNLTMWDSTIEDFEMIMAAREAHIHNRIIKEKDGYYSWMLENGRNFSGGELQRMELARALSADPTILLLDEFTSALDAVTEAEVFRSIRDKGTTCVIVAHRLSTVASCDYILVMENGRIVQRGTHEELYHTEGLYQELLKVPGEH